MKLCFVTSGAVNGFKDDDYKSAKGADVVVFGFNGLGIVNYKNELSGIENGLEDLARLSKELGSVVMSGCDTDTFGVFRHSVAVADSGRLLGVTDALFEDTTSDYKCGSGLKVYETTVGKLGVLAGGDVLYPELFSKIADAEGDAVFCVMKRIYDFTPQLMVRSSAFSSGLPVALCASGYAAVSDTFGEITAASRSRLLSVEMPPAAQYRVVTSKRRRANKINV